MVAGSLYQKHLIAVKIFILTLPSGYDRVNAVQLKEGIDGKDNT